MNQSGQQSPAPYSSPAAGSESGEASVRMKSTIIIIAAVIALVFCVLGITAIRKTMASAQATAEMSKMSYLGKVLTPHLEEYYREHGNYPPSLMDLRIPEKELMGDGSKPEDLTRFQYDSGSNVFHLIWSNPIYGFKLEGVGTEISWSTEKAKYR